MALAQAFAFIGIAVVLVLFAMLALVRIAAVRLDSSLGILRDGLPEGSVAPAWHLPDTTREMRQVPSDGARWRLLLFANHSLIEFPDLATGVMRLTTDEPDLEALVLTRTDVGLTATACDLLGLDVPVLAVDDDFYWRHNVRVMPFVFVVDPNGIVRASGIVAFEEALLRMWRFARSIPPTAPSGRLRVRGP